MEQVHSPTSAWAAQMELRSNSRVVQEAPFRTHEVPDTWYACPAIVEEFPRSHLPSLCCLLWTSRLLTFKLGTSLSGVAVGGLWTLPYLGHKYLKCKSTLKGVFKCFSAEY